MFKKIKSILRGEFGLFKTFWVFGFFGSLLISLVMNEAYKFQYAVYVPIFIFFSLLLLIVTISTWNAATKYIHMNKGKFLSFFAYIAKIWVIYYAFLWVTEMPHFF